MQTHSKYKFINWLRRRNQQRKRTLLLTGLILTLLFLAKMSVAQERPQDRSLSAEQIMAIVKKFHPIASIAGINIEKAKADITIARDNLTRNCTVPMHRRHLMAQTIIITIVRN